MFVSGVVSNIQAQYFQADFKYSQTSQYELNSSNGKLSGSVSSAITLSLSITAINVTTGFLAAEQTIDDTAPDDNSHTRAGGVAHALKNLLKELDENDGLTGKVAKRLFKLVNTLNMARGTDTKLGQLDKDDRAEVRSARQEVNDFFRAKHSTILLEEDLVNFISLVAKLETLREFALRTEYLLSTLNGGEEETEESDSEEEQVSLINIEI